MTLRKIIIAPNAFKGALSATEAAKAIRRGLANAGFKGAIIEMPIADGGDGSLDVMANYLDLEIRKAVVRGPLGKEVVAAWGLNNHKKLAVIEMAEASGLRLMKADELNPMKATSYGTGELILRAISRDAREVYLTVGGSATVDLGVGIMEALGVKFLSNGKEVKNLKPADFKRIDELDLAAINGIKRTFGLRILSDVTNPLLGKEGAAAVFGPQKGADEAMVEQLEDNLGHMASLLERATGKSLGGLTGGGAAGGVTAGLYAILDAEILDGAAQILTWAGFDQQLSNTDLVITGEGKIDTQTNHGKGPGLVARKANNKGVKVIGLSGILDDDLSSILNFDRLIALSDPHTPLEISMKNTALNLEKAAAAVIEQLSAI